MAFTEFYCQTTGNNLNAGSTQYDDAAYTSPANGAWDKDSGSNEGTFTPVSGDPSATVSAGMWASLYADAAAVPNAIMKVKSVTSTTIVFNQLAFSGTIPADAANGYTVKVGGAWKGPNAAVNHPFNFITAAAINAAGDCPRVNLKNNATYDVTAAITHSLAGPVRFQGYTSTAGDLGKATIDCATAGASILVLTASGANQDYADLIISNSGATSGSSSGFTISGEEVTATRCVVHSVRLHGFSLTAVSYLIECEAYSCNKANAAGGAGIQLAIAGCTAIRCVSHDNTGSNSNGFTLQGAGVNLINCISDTNGLHGAIVNATRNAFISGCDFYNNGGSGVDMTTASAIAVYIENSNFVKNAVWGINSSGSSLRNGSIVNCGFGAGTEANASGTINTNTGGILIEGTVTYAANVTPYNAPTTGDFDITLAAAKSAGRGAFTQTQASYTGTLAAPCIGASQQAGAAAASGGSYVFIG